MPCSSLKEVSTVYDPEFYIVQLEALQVGTTKVATSDRLIVDSGSNMMFCPKSVVLSIQEAFSKHHKPVITLSLKTPTGALTLSIPNEVYAQGSNLFIQESETPKHSIIIGTLLLKNTVIEFDAIHKKLKIGNI